MVRFVRTTVAAALCVVVALAAAPAAGASPAADYVVGEGDVLQVTVFDHPDLATTSRVTREGQIRFPLIGQVFVAGLAVPRVADVITARLANGYIIDPQVTVSVQEYRARKVNIIGRVNRPGVYEFRGKLSFLELLSRAEGLAPDAGGQAVLTRADPREPKVQIDLRALLTRGNTALDVEVRDGDSVYIGEAGVFYLTGEVRRPGEYRFEEGMTVIRALTLAGGFTERAATDRLHVIRAEESGERVLEVGAGTASLEAPVRRGDIIVVNVARTEVCFVTGEVKSAGAFRCDKDTTVLKAVTLAGGFTDAAAKNKIRIIRRVNGQEQVREKVGLEEIVQPDDVLVIPKSFF
jgi:polysaccharide export outer membrane protein